MNEKVLPSPHDYAPAQKGFGRAFIDVDEWREGPEPHRFLHGRFEGTQTLFSLYLPPAAYYRGRLLQYLEGGAGGHENVLQAQVFGPAWQFGYAFGELGAILAESNQGHPPNAGHTGFHDDVYLFGASAETARFAKWLAEQLYGEPVHHTYVFGASGGGHRSFQCLMRAPDVYDGAVPEVFGVNPGAHWSALGNAVSLLGEDARPVRDALEPGGSGDAFAGLTFGQREALRDLFHMGFPRDAATQLANLPVFPFALYNTLEHNPRYFTDFWHTRGYIGADQPERLAGRLVRTTTTVREVTAASELSSELMVAMQLATAGASPQTPYGAVLDHDDPGSLFMATLTITSGKAAGRRMVVANVVHGRVLLPFGEKCPELFEGVEPGDEVEVDNSDWLAFCHLYQHNVEFNVPGLHGLPDRVPAGYGRFAVHGHPVHAQTGTALYDLDVVEPFPGKMIYIGATHDAFIWPTKVTLFDRYVRYVLGDAASEHYRMWWVENSSHAQAEIGLMFTEDQDPALWRTRLVDYEAVSAAALSALRAWVEEGTEPPADSAYDLSADMRLLLTGDAAARGGVQPVVRLTVNGGERADIRAGESVVFEGSGEVPPGGGSIVEVALDAENADAWPYVDTALDGGRTAVAFTASHVYTTPGTYFPVFRVGAHRDGHDRKGEAVRNIARVRVVVGPSTE
ncbi:tannase/feruloyl esterase family alpha/beta hydrolase [Nonomuraea sp. NPDC002799]